MYRYKRQNQYDYALLWLIYIAVSMFGIFIVVINGYFSILFENDPTRISNLVLLLFLIGTLHCAFRVRFITYEFKHIHEIECELQNSEKLDESRFPKESPVWDFMKSNAAINDQALHTGLSVPQHAEQLVQVLNEKICGEHEYGWFVSSLLVKLGLLGTVVGFVLMLVSLSSIQVLEFSSLQEMISNMAVGMGVALVTTLVGLTSSILLSFQYLLLDRAADKLISQCIQVNKIYVLNIKHRHSDNDFQVAS